MVNELNKDMYKLNDEIQFSSRDDDLNYELDN